MREFRYDQDIAWRSIARGRRLARQRRRRLKIIRMLLTGAPASAQALAREAKVSARTVYREINSMKADGHPIRGEAGIGYVMARRRAVAHV